jgi:hypothetical protein
MLVSYKKKKDIRVFSVIIALNIEPLSLICRKCNCKSHRIESSNTTCSDTKLIKLRIRLYTSNVLKAYSRILTKWYYNIMMMMIMIM